MLSLMRMGGKKREGGRIRREVYDVMRVCLHGAYKCVLYSRHTQQRANDIFIFLTHPLSLLMLHAGRKISHMLRQMCLHVESIE